MSPESHRSRQITPRSDLADELVKVGRQSASAVASVKPPISARGSRAVTAKASRWRRASLRFPILPPRHRVDSAARERLDQRPLVLKEQDLRLTGRNRTGHVRRRRGAGTVPAASRAGAAVAPAPAASVVAATGALPGEPVSSGEKTSIPRSINAPIEVGHTVFPSRASAAERRSVTMVPNSNAHAAALATRCRRQPLTVRAEK